MLKSLAGLSRWRAVLPVLLLSLLPFLFFWRLFAPNPLDRMWLPEGDLTHQYFPLRVFAAREIAASRLPLWNPHIYAGQPGLADPQVAALYPLNLLTALLLGLLNRPFTFMVLQLQIILHYSLAALFTYLFAHRLTGSRFAAGTAALVFTFGGYLTSYPAQQPTILAGAVWLPLVLLLLDWAGAQSDLRRRLRGLAGAGTAMAVSILAGHPQTAIYVLYIAVAYWAYLIVRERHQRQDGRMHARARLRARRAVGRLLSAFCLLPSGFQHPVLQIFVFLALALGLSAVQWLPTLEFTRLSTRAELGYAFTSSGFQPHEIVTLLIPGYFGGSPLYLGVIPLLLAGAAFIGRQTVDRRRQPKAIHRPPSLFWLLLALVALFLSFGDSSFLYSLFYLLAPGFAQVRNQERAALLWSFALAMLAALGAARIGSPLSRTARARLGGVESFLGWLMAGLAGLIALAYVGSLANQRAEVNLLPGALRHLVPSFFWVLAAWTLWRLRLHTAVSRRWLMLATLCAIALNLFSVNAPYHFQKRTPPNYFPETPLTRALKAELATNPTARVASEALLPGAHNAGAVYNFEDIAGNDPLQLRSPADFEQGLHVQRRWSLLAVRYVVSKRDIAGSAFTPVARDGEVGLFRYDEARPRAWLVHAARVVAPDKTFETLNGDFDAAATVVLNAEPPIDLPPVPPAGTQVDVIEHRPGRLVLRTRSAANGLLVVSEVLYPGWQARVDGRSASLLPADGVLMAVPLSGGTHVVELTFEPDSVKMGALISAISLLALLLGLAGLRRGERRLRDGHSS